MTLTTFFWILVSVSILVLMANRFGIKKELLTPVFLVINWNKFYDINGHTLERH